MTDARTGHPVVARSGGYDVGVASLFARKFTAILQSRPLPGVSLFAAASISSRRCGVNAMTRPTLPSILAISLIASSIVGCTNYSDQLARAEQYYGNARYEA